jgi:uncharacterized membrane protein
MAAPDRDAADRRMEQALGNLLRVGVIVAAALVLFGAVIYLWRHGLKEPDLKIFHGEPAEFRDPLSILALAWQFRGRGLIMLGVLALIATPVVRVAFSALGFTRERDWVYVAVTLTVLGLLLFSLFIGHPGSEEPPPGGNPEAAPAAPP